MAPTVIFSVVIERKEVDGAFLLENPWLQGIDNAVPMLIGFNTAEGAYWTSSKM